MTAMEDKLIMSRKELERKTLLEGFIYKKLTLKDAAKKMGISYRQAKRIWKRYKTEKDAGLQHKNRGKKPRNTYSDDFKEKIFILYRNKYMEFGPTFAAEKLLEDDNQNVNPETLRIWLKKEGLWTKKRKRQIHREQRERRPCFGDLLQIDGSIHNWFFGIEEKSCLLNIVDDATGVTLALLDKGETTAILLKVFKKWVECYGIPKAVYVDLKSVYVSPKRMKEKYDDDLLIKEGFSVFEQVCKELNIKIIKAYSPQAKGRVERKHAVFQDRFVKDLKLYGIKTIAAANNYLEDKFLNKINDKFAQAPEGLADSHREPNSYGDLEQIFCWRYRRQLKNDWTIQLERQYYQVERGYEDLLKPSAKVIIKKYLNGKMCFWYEGKKLSYHQLSQKPIPPSKTKKYYQPKGYNPLLKSKLAKANKHRTPWSQFRPNWLKSPNTTTDVPKNLSSNLSDHESLSDP
jgi:transposase